MTSINQSISFNETKNRLKVPAETAAAGIIGHWNYCAIESFNER